jgi:hypothetical protein
MGQPANAWDAFESELAGVESTGTAVFLRAAAKTPVAAWVTNQSIQVASEGRHHMYDQAPNPGTGSSGFRWRSTWCLPGMTV